MKYLGYLLLTLSLMLSCQKQEREISYYFWRTQLELGPVEQTFLHNSNGEALFVRFFDVDKINGRFEPKGIITKSKNDTIDKKITPVVFITNQSWVNISEEELDFLVDRISETIQDRASALSLNLTQEIQIDSDWTPSTKEDYFAFLRKLKTKTQKDITSTLRLHQVKDKEANGIPPIDKAYLMCYATSSPLEESDVNSILDYNLLKNYLADINEYPLQLRYAFPIYSWGIVTNHLGKKRMINGLSHQVLDRTEGIVKIKEHLYQVEKDGFYFNQFLNAGFTIKVEEIPNDLLQKSIKFIDKTTNHKAPIVLYHLDERFLGQRENLKL